MHGSHKIRKSPSKKSHFGSQQNRKRIPVIILVLFSLIATGSIISQLNFTSLYVAAFSNEEVSDLDIQILIILPPFYHRGAYIYSKLWFEEMGYGVTVSATHTSEVCHELDYPVTADCYIRDLSNISTYEAIYIPSGDDYVEMGANVSVCNLLRNASDAGLWISASGTATYILGAAGLIEGCSVTGSDGLGIDYEGFGANFTNSGFEVDGRIITAQRDAVVDLQNYLHEQLIAENVNRIPFGNFAGLLFCCLCVITIQITRINKKNLHRR